MSGEALFCILLIVLGAAMQFAFLQAYGPRIPVGDEREFLQRGEQPDPHRPDLYLRVPLHLWVAQRMAHRGAAAERDWRRLNCAMSVATVVIGALAAASIGGAPAALVYVLMSLMLAERLVLGAHLWPDTWLALLGAAACALMLHLEHAWAVPALGIVCALAAMTRIEQLALLAGSAVAVVLASRSAAAAQLPWIVLPAGIALGAWTMIAFRRYRIPLPDTTWRFNLEVLQQGVLDATRGPASIRGSVGAVRRRRETNAAATGAARTRSDAPRAHFQAQAVALLRRALSSVGPDTFVRQRLLPPMGKAYPSLAPEATALLSLWLRWSYPLFSAASLWLILVTDQLPAPLLPGAFVWAALVLFHFRTRYRIVLVPWIAVAAANAFTTLHLEHLHARAIALGLLLLAVAAALVLWPPVVDSEA